MTNDTTPPTGAAPAAPVAPATPVQPVAPPATGASLLDQAKPPVDGAPAAPVGDDWLPAKYQVKKDDGTLDEAASARKLAEAHKALESRLGTTELPPKTPEEYAPTIEAEGVNFDELKADPLYQGFLKGAHAKGLTNDQVSYVLNEYLARAPQLAGAVVELTVEEARAELGKIWSDDATVSANLTKGYKTLQAYASDGDENTPGSLARLQNKYANDPDFWAFAASVGKELAEDSPPQAGAMPTQMDVDALMKSEAYWKPNHPDHAKVKAQVMDFFAKKYPDKK